MSMALFVALGESEEKDSVVKQDARLSVSFALLTAGWVTALLPACCFWPVKS